MPTNLENTGYKISKPKLNKQTVNVIRTSQRNNIELTAIADNKASILMSLNALMITFLTPMIVANTKYILESYLYIPLVILTITCFLTIYVAAKVLKPSNFSSIGFKEGSVNQPSPFFFGNFYKMEADDYFEFVQDGLGDKELLLSHMVQDLFFVGKRLGKKMDLIKFAFNVFIIGVFLTLLSTGIILSVS